MQDKTVYMGSIGKHGDPRYPYRVRVDYGENACACTVWAFNPAHALSQFLGDIDLQNWTNSCSGVATRSGNKLSAKEANRIKILVELNPIYKTFPPYDDVQIAASGKEDVG